MNDKSSANDGAEEEELLEWMVLLLIDWSEVFTNEFGWCSPRAALQVVNIIDDNISLENSNCEIVTIKMIIS